MVNIAILARNLNQENTLYQSASEEGLLVSTCWEQQKALSGISTIKKRELKITLENLLHTRWSGVIKIELSKKGENPRYFLPAFLYGRNRGEVPQRVENQFPRIRKEQDCPSSPEWMIRADRISHPAAIIFDEGNIWGIAASPYFIMDEGEKKQWQPDRVGSFYQYAGFGCSYLVEVEQVQEKLCYTLGYENAPWLFVDSHHIKERASMSEQNSFTIEAGERISIVLEVYEGKAESELAVHTILKDIYIKYHQKPRVGDTIEETVKLMSGAVAKDCWEEDKMMYAAQVFETEQEGCYRYNELGSFSWTNGLSVAVPQLIAAIRIRDEEIRKQALECIHGIISGSMNERSGFPYTAYTEGHWSNHGWWFDLMETSGHSSYIVGQGIYYLLKAYEYEKRLMDCDREEWLAYAEPIIEYMEGSKNQDHEYPYIWSETTGAGLEYDSFSGTWCLAAIAYYSYLTGEKHYIRGLIESEAHYYEAYVRKVECYGTPLDTSKAIDSEGILAYIRAMKYLYLLTKDEKYLDHMRDGLYYEYTFKFIYNVPIQVAPLSKVGWSSCGGSVTSTCNPHIHPMSSSIVDEMLFYLERRADNYIYTRMLDTIGWGCQCHNTYEKEYDYGHRGWMSERFCYSEGLLTENYPTGEPSSTWFCLMPWAVGSILEGLAGDYWERRNKESNTY